MSDLLQPGDDILFMKVGTHAAESLEDIVARKRAEIESAGFALWGYGGNTCHPLTMVQPFARSASDHDGQIRLYMQPMNSNHFAVTKRATQYSSDGIDWKEVPAGINVVGSRYALAIEDLHEEEFDLPLEHTRVALGKSKGRRGDQYIKGRVDKACLEVVDAAEVVDDVDQPEAHIGLVAKLVDPYAVFVKD